MNLDKQVILDMLKRLRRRDRTRRLFGAAEHDYRLNPPVSVSVVEKFERTHGIVLPEDYRYFITEIGNGGAGPYYGLFPFELHDGSLSLPECDGGDLIGDVSKPFPHAKGWNLPRSFWDQEPEIPHGTLAEEDRMVAEWDQVEQEHYWNPSIMNGAIPICHLGCALRQWLVVSGDQRGFIWSDYRADRRGIFPLQARSGRPMSFSDWYLSWLNESLRATSFGNRIADFLRGGKQVKVISFHEEDDLKLRQAGQLADAIAAPRQVAHRGSRRRDLLAALILIAAGVVLGVAIALRRRR
ncbi:MAG: SMI1/KNR4 family protein [Deltaproteobacteria bacterium]